MSLRQGVITMADALTKEGIKYMISRLLENANEAVEESKENKDDAYCSGRKIAYYGKQNSLTDTTSQKWPVVFLYTF